MNNPHFQSLVQVLNTPPAPNDAGDVEADTAAIADTLAAFKVDAQVTGARRGPVITRYEVLPARGVRVAKITSLDADICRAMAAVSIRIQAPVPGTDIVGIEVPNKNPDKVSLREMVETDEFRNATAPLTVALGKDIAGVPTYADLAEMPHLLIAGATNSGKSVMLNNIIASLAIRCTPEELKLFLIDPKRVELAQWSDLPHLGAKVATEVRDGMSILRKMLAEMEDRYKTFEVAGVRNIASYNALNGARLPYMVVVIDELAEIMMTSAWEAEKLLCRLAQLARATGIHLIVATQRPSVNVITGTIKANFPSRIAFALPSHHDSRTIIDDRGAEKLIGKGDMLFMKNNALPVRIQSAYVSDEEIDKVVNAAAQTFTL